MKVVRNRLFLCESMPGSLSGECSFRFSVVPDTTNEAGEEHGVGGETGGDDELVPCSERSSAKTAKVFFQHNANASV